MAEPKPATLQELYDAPDLAVLFGVTRREKLRAHMRAGLPLSPSDRDTLAKYPMMPENTAVTMLTLGFNRLSNFMKERDFMILDYAEAQEEVRPALERAQRPPPPPKSTGLNL